MAFAMSSGDALTRVPRYHTNCVLEETSSITAAGRVVQPSHDQILGRRDATWSLGAPLKRTRPRAQLVASNTANHKSCIALSRAPLPLAQRHVSSLIARPLPCRSARYAPNDDVDHSWTLHPPAATAPSSRPGRSPTSDAHPGDPDPVPSPPHCLSATPIADVQAAPATINPEDGTSEIAETDENEQAQAAHWAARVAELEAEIKHIRAEQRRARDQARRDRLQLQLSASLPPLPTPPSSVRSNSSPKSRSPVLDKLSFLAKARRARVARCSSISPTSSLGASLYCQSSTQEPMSRNFIEAGGRGQTDAPRGASNGTERVSGRPCGQMYLSVGLTGVSVSLSGAKARLLIWSLELKPVQSIFW